MSNRFGASQAAQVRPRRRGDRVQIETAGVPIAAADVVTDEAVRLQFQVSPGHVPLSARTELVHVVFGPPETAA